MSRFFGLIFNSIKVFCFLEKLNVSTFFLTIRVRTRREYFHVVFRISCKKYIRCSSWLTWHTDFWKFTMIRVPTVSKNDDWTNVIDAKWNVKHSCVWIFYVCTVSTGVKWFFEFRSDHVGRNLSVVASANAHYRRVIASCGCSRTADIGYLRACLGNTKVAGNELSRDTKTKTKISWGFLVPFRDTIVLLAALNEHRYLYR